MGVVVTAGGLTIAMLVGFVLLNKRAKDKKRKAIQPYLDDDVLVKDEPQRKKIVEEEKLVQILHLHLQTILEKRKVHLMPCQNQEIKDCNNHNVVKEKVQEVHMLLLKKEMKMKIQDRNFHRFLEVDPKVLWMIMLLHHLKHQQVDVHCHRCVQKAICHRLLHAVLSLVLDHPLHCHPHLL